MMLNPCMTFMSLRGAFFPGAVRQDGVRRLRSVPVASNPQANEETLAPGASEGQVSLAMTFNPQISPMSVCALPFALR
jgi:hypothetical protein